MERRQTYGNEKSVVIILKRALLSVTALCNEEKKTATVLSVGWKLSKGEAFAVLFCRLPPRGIWQLTWPLPWAFAIQGSKRGK